MYLPFPPFYSVLYFKASIQNHFSTTGHSAHAQQHVPHIFTMETGPFVPQWNLTSPRYHALTELWHHWRSKASTLHPPRLDRIVVCSWFCIVSAIFCSCFVLQNKLQSGCSGSGDYVELLGGNGVDTSKMFPVADLCFSLSGLGESEPHHVTSRGNRWFSL